MSTKTTEIHITVVNIGQYVNDKKLVFFFYFATLVPSDWMWNQSSSCLWPCCCDKQMDPPLGEYPVTSIQKLIVYTIFTTAKCSIRV